MYVNIIGIALGLYSIRLTKENDKLQKQNAALTGARALQLEMIVYLCEMLDRNEIEFDDFDAIVLGDIISR